MPVTYKLLELAVFELMQESPGDFPFAKHRNKHGKIVGLQPLPNLYAKHEVRGLANKQHCHHLTCCISMSFA